jgi:NAD(P)-dependent dehydrogenase (short-subunit alcohol dehydrogenase family)
MLRFDGKVALITGAGRGLGRAHAMLLAGRGAAVLVNDLGADLDGTHTSAAPAHEVVAEITAAGGRAVANFDSVATSPEAIVAAAVDTFGRLDIVVNNAGFEQPVPFGKSTLDDIRRHLDVHFLGTAGVTLAAWPHLVASGSGRVVNTTSATVYGMANRTGYGAAKAAIFGFTRSLAIDGAEAGVKANCVAPGAGTRMADASDTPDEMKAYMRERMPPSLVSQVVAYLAHEQCAISGETLAAAGGKVSRMTLGETNGFTDISLTPETVRARLAEALDPSSFRVFEHVMLSLNVPGISRAGA